MSEPQKNEEFLKIDRPAKYGVVIEGVDSTTTSLFNKIYSDAKDNVRNIITANKMMISDKNSNDKTEEALNTTIAFIGGRGTGKSSAMVSFSNYLSKKGAEDLREEGFGKYRFYSIPVIDANQLGKNETIIGRISAALITEYNKQKTDLSVEDKREFIRLAKHANDVAVKYTSGEWFKTGDTLIDETVSISQMREDVKKLIRQFLKIKMKDADNSYLVVSVDDIDMGIENSYSIMEEIRKFLCIPNVIVLVSLDVKQLEIVLKANYIKTLGRESLEDTDVLTVKNLSYRYVEKLFPYGRQHRMPELSLVTLQRIRPEGFFNDGTGEESDEELWKKWELGAQGSTPTVFDAVLHLIWRKTTLLPICNSEGDHLLVPRNLRSLYNLVVFLRNLPDAIMHTDTKPPMAKERVGIITKNLDAFRSYLLDNLELFDVRDMSADDQHMARLLLNVVSEFPDMTLLTMNSKIVADILYGVKATKEGNIYRDTLFGKVTDMDSSAEQLIEASVYPDSISVGDLRYVIGKIDATTKCRYIRYLIEVIRTLWSVKMTKEFYMACSANITHKFRRGIGGLIINPDKADFCHVKGRGSELKKHWFTCGQNSDSVDLYSADIKSTYRGPHDYDSFIKHIASSMVVCINDKNEDSKYWRRWRHYAKPYFECVPTQNGSQFNNMIYIHPYAVFTHIIFEDENNGLSVNIGSNKNLAAGIRGKFDEKGLSHMPIPLYSLDFLYRWYETMRRRMKAAPTGTYFECFKQLFDIGGSYTENPIGNEFFMERIKRYIPEKFIDNIITEPMRTIQDYLHELVFTKSETIQKDDNGDNNMVGIISELKRIIKKRGSKYEDDKRVIVSLLNGVGIQTISEEDINSVQNAKSGKDFVAQLRVILGKIDPCPKKVIDNDH